MQLHICLNIGDFRPQIYGTNGVRVTRLLCTRTNAYIAKNSTSCPAVWISYRS